MKYLEQSCIPLEDRMQLADAALGYAEALASHETVFWTGYSAQEIGDSLRALALAESQVRSMAVLVSQKYREAV